MVVDQDEFVEVELVGESFPFGLVQDVLVVVVSASEMFSVSGCNDMSSVRLHVEWPNDTSAPVSQLRGTEMEVFPKWHPRTLRE